MATKTIFEYLEAEIDKEKITDEKIFHEKLNFEYLLKKAFFSYLKDKKKIEKAQDPKKHDRRKIKW